ncbi:MATE family efflux transporter [Palaeococcus sp. (in: euryarchaeotes)]|uniref:MATE family efflux transporter n=1 Tax=Palaeococcus sp. (in: euryarchaeotes) TaxID=2820298 RepID=UPI0025CCF076|nr:MATE family efflux transporter [Palaeococcus sp. (in: euryarchaeotes)]MCD6559398.1 MATE family efflux transporter [Palaeococcus sp. (in: euryarchaeotes)]
MKGSTKVQEMREEIIGGNIEKTLLKLAWPLIVSNIIQVLYNITDTFWLGKLGREALSAPGVSWPLIGTLMSLGMGFATAGFAFVGQYIGAENYEKANRAAGALYSLMLIFASVVALVGVLITPYALKFMNVTSTVYPYALVYLRVIFVGIPFSFTFFSFSFLMRAVGDTKTPVKISLFTVALNILLDPILIFGWLGFPKLGVEGAALATITSNSLGSLIGAYLLFTGRAGIHLTRETLKPDLEFYKRIFRVGLPSSIGSSANSFGFVVLTRIIFGFGDVTYAAYTITTRLVNFLTSISRGISMAMGTMIAQNVGAEKYERAKKIAERTMMVNFTIASAAILLIGAFRVPLFKVFLNDPAVISESKIVLEYFLISVPFFNGIFMVSTNVFRSAGHTKKSMVVDMLRLWGLRIPLSYAFGYVIMKASKGVFFGMGLSNFIAAGVAFAWFMKGSWMRRIIEED